MTDKVRIGVIGTGFGVRVHLPGFARTDAVEVVGVCSARKDRAHAVAEQFGVPFATDDYRELIARDDVEVVDIVTPPGTHREIALAAFDAGKHVLCEKPLALNAFQARDMYERARSSGLLHIVNHEMRFDPVRRYIRRLVREGYLGTMRFLVLGVHVNHGEDPGQEPYYYGWAVLAEPGGGFVMALLTHQLDLMRFCFGDIYDIQTRSAIFKTERPMLTFDYRDGDPIGADTPTEGVRPVDAEDTVAFNGVMSSGALLSVSGSWVLHFPTGIRLDAYGDRGTLHLQPDGRLFGARVGEGELKELSVPGELFLPEVPGEHRLMPGFIALVNELAAEVRGGTITPDVLATFQDGYRLQVVMDRVRGMPVPSDADAEVVGA
jgi:predicted dehydrogenase